MSTQTLSLLAMATEWCILSYYSHDLEVHMITIILAAIRRFATARNGTFTQQRLIQCAFVEGLHDQAYCVWSHRVQTWLHCSLYVQL